jgi:hypothetical protein
MPPDRAGGVLTAPAIGDQVALMRVTEGDWYRIAAADYAGTNAMPYHAPFLRNQREALFYDRFLPNSLTEGGTARQTFAGYHHALVGAGGFFDKLVVNHFSSHYRQMNMIAHLEFAALLTFSRRLTDLVREHDPADQADQFRAKLQSIRRDFLTFIHRYHFTDVSNHLQAREMNARLRQSMGLDGLRAEIDAEIAAASDFAATMDQTDSTRAQERLSQVAALFLPATVAIGAGGMNIITDLDDGQTLATAAECGMLSFWGALAYFCATAILWGFRSDRPTAPERRLIDLTTALTVILGVASPFLFGLALWG